MRLSFKQSKRQRCRPARGVVLQSRSMGTEAAGVRANAIVVICMIFGGNHMRAAFMAERLAR